MKKRIIPILLLILFALVLNGCLLGYPPIRGERITDPQRYLKTNTFVTRQRKALAEEGALTPDFLPAQIDPQQTDAYLYWYSCALVGDPNYAISVTLSFPDEEDLQGERERIQSLDGFAESQSDEQIILYKNSVPFHLGWFFDDEVLDGSEYVMQYAILSPEDRTITYSEAIVWEGQIVDETIRGQMEQLHERLGAAEEE